MIVLSIIFCLVLLAIFVVFLYLRKQAVAYVKLGVLYTNKFMNSEITLEDYSRLKRSMEDGLSPLLRKYLKKRGII